MEDRALPDDGQPRQPPAADDDRVAVSIRGAVKTYDGRHAVLKGLNMTVPKGKIYGLLGPSGCGKTTLLGVIVGKNELDSGDVMVSVNTREDIGFMPQDLNLHKNLTILQTFKFYGRMFNLHMDTILERVNELSIMLELPSYNCMIHTLSGGQQRRVSLGVALLHNPNILILDEPTVGLDPVLSHSIWNHLVSFADEGKTIIITTHYIEEARQAHTIGMMRDGILVAEESPEMLITHCNTTNLEDAFLMLSQKQESSSDNQFDYGQFQNSHHKKSKTKLNFNEHVLKMNRINCLLYKNICLFLQQRSFTALLILLPLSTTYCFNLAIGPDPQGINIAVVNKELQQKQIEKCEPEHYDGCFFEKPQDLIMSCAYIKHMQSKSLNILHYDDVDKALMDVKKNHAWGLLYFPENYTRSFAVRFTKPAETPEEYLASSTVQAWLDMSNQFIGNIIKAKMFYGMLEYMGNSLTQCNVSTKLGRPPISFRKPVHGTLGKNFVYYSSSALLCLCCYFLPALFTLGLILTEKEEGMMERMMISGIRFSEVLVSTVIVQLVVHVIQTAISMYVMYVHFDSPYIGNHIPTVTVLILIGMEGMIMGFFIAAICNSFMIAAYIGAGINMAYSLTCGLVWPLDGSHYVIRIIGPYLPINGAIKAYVAITAKGWSFESGPVYMGLLSIFCWSCIKIFGIFIVSRFNKDLWISRK